MTFLREHVTNGDMRVRPASSMRGATKEEAQIDGRNHGDVVKDHWRSGGLAQRVTALERARAYVKIRGGRYGRRTDHMFLKDNFDLDV